MGGWVSSREIENIIYKSGCTHFGLTLPESGSEDPTDLIDLAGDPASLWDDGSEQTST